MAEKLKNTQPALERAMFEIIGLRTRNTDIMETVAPMGWQLMAHVSRQEMKRW